MIEEKIFLKKYPISINDSIIFPLIYKSYFNQKGKMLPDPNIKHMIDFSKFAGFSEGAVRTACSRLKKKGSIISYKDDGKIKFRMGEDRQRVTNYYIDSDKKKEFTIIIFSFKRNNTNERYQIRKILKKSGFKMIAQNTYISLRIRKEELIKKIKKFGFENNIYIFDTYENLEPFVVNNILKAWDIEEYIKKLNDFYPDFLKFISFKDGHAKTIFNHLGYAGVVIFSYFQRNEPPLAEEFLTLEKEMPIKKINKKLIELNMRYASLTNSYYLELS